MRSLKIERLFRGLGLVGVVVLATACQTSERGDEAEETIDLDKGAIEAALNALPSAKVLDVDFAGIPNFVTGNLGGAGGTLSETDVRGVLARVAPAFRLSEKQLRFKGAQVDQWGDVSYAFVQTKNGREVFGGDLIVHARKGVVFAINGSARDDLAAPNEAKISPQAAMAAAQGVALNVVNELGASSDRELLYYRGEDNRMQLVYRTMVTGVQADGTPVRDQVFINAEDGSVAARIPTIHTARNRELHNLNHGTSLPGPVARTETQAPVADQTVNLNFDHLGTVYDVYKNSFGRDSFDGAGAKLISSVHYSNNYVNAFWNGTQMVYGDGDGQQASNLAHSLDVTGHELTHAVTERTSNLTYSAQSGGLNEALSDMFGNYIEWVKEGRPATPNKLTTWTVGDDCWTPNTPGDGLRYMYDPKKDGRSNEHLADYTSGTDVHYSSGIPNLAFYLLSVGGTHPRNRTTINVPAIGIEKAAQIYFKANAGRIFTASTNFAQAKTATEEAARQLGYTAAEIDAVSKSWQAVGVGAPTAPAKYEVSNISGARGSQNTYTHNVPAGSSGLSFKTTGSSGDADLYIKFGSAPTTSSYDCRGYTSSSNETCNIATARAGTYHIMIHGYTAYSGVKLTVNYSP